MRVRKRRERREQKKMEERRREQRKIEVKAKESRMQRNKHRRKRKQRRESRRIIPLTTAATLAQQLMFMGDRGQKSSVEDTQTNMRRKRRR